LRTKTTLQKGLLILFSFYFYYKSSGNYLFLLLLTVGADFLFSHLIIRAKTPRIATLLTAVAILFSLSFLLYFKYLDFFLQSFGFGQKTNQSIAMVLPIGISFYTFQSISYLVDVQYYLDNVSVTQAVYNSNMFATATARQVRITVTNSTPALLYYWCWNHLAMGNSIAVADPGSGTGSGSSVSVDDTAPSSPSPGNLWLDTNTGILYVYFDDGNSEQWIQPVFPYPDTKNLATL
jgi:hypothetical protein